MTNSGLNLDKYLQKRGKLWNTYLVQMRCTVFQSMEPTIRDVSRSFGIFKMYPFTVQGENILSHPKFSKWVPLPCNVISIFFRHKIFITFGGEHKYLSSILFTCLVPREDVNNSSTLRTLSWNPFFEGTFS